MVKFLIYLRACLHNYKTKMYLYFCVQGLCLKTMRESIISYIYKEISTRAASMLSRWNSHIFPRAETALSYAIVLSEWCALGSLITAFNRERASANKCNKRFPLKKDESNNSKKRQLCKWLINYLQQVV